jgi:HEAT repeat protein
LAILTSNPVEEAMMAVFSERVQTVLETDCAHTIEEIVEKPTDTEIADLIGVLDAKADVTPNQRQRAVFLLGRMGHKKAAPLIITALPRLDEGGRIAAADALGRLATDDAEAAVVNLAHDVAPQVRKFAARALARIGKPTALGHLRGMVDGDAEPFVRAAAGKMLSRME